MKLEFTKMHGLGNDFMVINQVTQNIQLNSDQIRRLSDRHTGVGFDQLLLVSPPTSPDVDFTYRIFNADGSEVEQCGNGARCFARFVRDKGLTYKDVIPVKTNTGKIELRLLSGNLVTVDMGAPVFEPDRIPLQAEKRHPKYKFNVESNIIELACLSMGNPHGVLQVFDVDSAPVNELGPKLEAHPRFPNKANIGFCQVVDRQNIRLRVYERGVGETRACGTGACAAAVASIAANLVDNNVTVSLPGGELQIEWQGEGHPVLMTGPATTVYDGTYFL
ncbi:diaminopimelate epimerase [Ketobacter sp. MCCC 1A13808]|uniref:diaminopimelate epimerase n=1 Tax=Ketobacter sp. MCCC 1A13808 TaxID=2602738 RepID=UPI000F225A03|nr:diaminopimelate epimerase [Ketobacter sp. MCCC 1A13808]MVF14042.1 diaminopimelate epimerase [Ketobacter sp. MCCC 1A13808]RLP55072.1 MAG: diaminopimelate epimerase [Ketobacter sp.]